MIGVVQIGEKESNVVGMDVSHSIGKRSRGVGIMKDGQIFCTYSFCIFVVQVEKTFLRTGRGRPIAFQRPTKVPILDVLIYLNRQIIGRIY